MQKLAITLLRRSASTAVAEVLREFGEPIAHPSGAYHARVVGRLAEDGMWEGWLEHKVSVRSRSQSDCSDALRFLRTRSC